jgi:SsrA-binding protein
MAIKIIATNKKAYHNYNLLDKFECGIVLIGPEVKSLRNALASFTDSYAHLDKGEIYLFNLHITPYEQASYNNEDPVRKRKLLLNKKEIIRLTGILTRKGLTLIPTKIYFNNRNFVKVELAVGEGKKNYDKRQDIKKAEVKREIDRAMKQKR